MPTTFFGWVAFLLEKYWPMFLRGAGNTMMIALIGTAVGCVIGLIVGIIQTIPVDQNTNIVKKIIVKVVQWLMSAYVAIFRGTPMIVQGMVIYYGAMEMFGIDMSPLTAALFVVSINTGAYMAESVRGGVFSVDIGQTEAAKAIGMTHFQTMKSVVMPQAFRNIMPQIGNNLIINIKDTSVLNVISMTKLYFNTTNIAGMYYKFFEPFFITCVIYFIMTYVTSKILRLIEKKIDGPQNYALVSDPMADLNHTMGRES